MGFGSKSVSLVSAQHSIDLCQECNGETSEVEVHNFSYGAMGVAGASSSDLCAVNELTCGSMGSRERRSNLGQKSKKLATMLNNNLTKSIYDLSMFNNTKLALITLLSVGFSLCNEYYHLAYNKDYNKDGKNTLFCYVKREVETKVGEPIVALYDAKKMDYGLKDFSYCTFIAEKVEYDLDNKTTPRLSFASGFDSYSFGFGYDHGPQNKYTCNIQKQVQHGQNLAYALVYALNQTFWQEVYKVEAAQCAAVKCAIDMSSAEKKANAGEKHPEYGLNLYHLLEGFLSELYHVNLLTYDKGKMIEKFFQLIRNDANKEKKDAFKLELESNPAGLDPKAIDKMKEYLK